MSLLKNTSKKKSAMNPREMIIFSYPKVGKTSNMISLPGKYLILDFEGGTDFFDSEAVSIPNLDTLTNLRGDFIAENPMYDFIVIDTITSLYAGVINALSVIEYNKDEGKKKPLDWDITLLNYGLGYKYKRAILQKIIKFFKQYCKCIILLGHVADKSLGGSGDEASVKDLDLEGKLKNILALKVDAMALMVRESKNKNYLDFTIANDKILGTRVKHLDGKKFLLSEKDPETGKIKTYWENIFLGYNK